MEKDIKQILQELHKIDKWLEIDQKDLEKAINLLKQTKPTVKIDPNFKQNLKNEIFEEIKNIKIKNLKKQNSIFKNIIYIFWGLGLAAFWIFAINKDLFTSIDKIIIPKTTKVEIVSEENLTTTNNNQEIKSYKSEIESDDISKNIMLKSTPTPELLQNNTENKAEPTLEKTQNPNLKSQVKTAKETPEDNSLNTINSIWELDEHLEDSDLSEMSVSSTFAPDMWFNADLADEVWNYEIKWFSYNKELNLNFDNKILKSNDIFEEIKTKLNLEKQNDYDYKNDFSKVYYNQYLWTLDINYNSWIVLKTTDYKLEIANYLNSLGLDKNKYVLSWENLIDWKKYFNYQLNINNFNIYNNYWDKIITTFIVDIENNLLLSVKNLDLNNYFQINQEVIVDKKIINKYLNNYNWENPTSLKDLEYLPRVIYVKYNKDWINYIWPALFFKDDYIVIILDKDLLTK